MTQVREVLKKNWAKNHPAFQSLKVQVQAWADNLPQLPDEEEVENRLHQMSTIEEGVRAMLPGEQQEFLGAVLTELLAEIRTVAPVGDAITRDHELWLEQRWEEQEWTWWRTYQRYLIKQGRPRKAVTEMETDIKNILEPSGDPAREGEWARRGLVIGDVQSGKTATYVGLMNMAYDAGYRVFVVIGGHTDDLRSQSQERVDQGFVGTESRSTDDRNFASDIRVGVGNIREKNNAFSITTVKHDFGATSKRATNVGNLDETFRGPVVLVVKKNASILRNLATWLRRSVPQEQLMSPMLVVDDESDYASVDTSKEDQDPTAVNEAIRSILRCAQRSSYIGFTATPFANVLMDVDVKDDLFPRDFIYALYAPPNYMSAYTYFGLGKNEDTGVEGEGHKHMRLAVDDAEESFPFRHKNHHPVPYLPDSLKRAVDTFILACALTDLSEGHGEDRSMLVHVSRFKSVQNEVEQLVGLYLDETRILIENQAPLWDGQQPMPKVLQRFHDVWKDEYESVGVSWLDVARALPDVVFTISTELVNGDTAPERQLVEMRRAQQRIKPPLRKIAVGGAILSRGITLEGLVISYFYQRTQLSDTLLQMGRWFGYRDSYRDLVRVWLNAEVREWFLFTAQTLDEIRADVSRMQSAGMTPEDFGLKVRKHPEALKITAANKMRHVEEDTVSLAFDRQSLQTKYATYRKEEISANRQRFLELAEHCLSVSKSREAGTELLTSSGGSQIFKGVDRASVEGFLSKFHPGPDENFACVPNKGSWVSAYAASLDPEVVPTWDVVFVSGTGVSVPLLDSGEQSFIRTNKRNNLTLFKTPRRHLSFSRRTVATGSNLVNFACEAENGLTREEWSRAEAALVDKQGKPRKLTRDDVLYRISRPILMIYRVSGEPDLENHPEHHPVAADEFVLGVVVAFPPERNDRGAVIESQKKVDYVVNKTWLNKTGLDSAVAEWEGRGDDHE